MNTNSFLTIFLIIILVVMLINTHVTIIKPQPVPIPVKPIGGCAGTRYGCCPNGVTPRINPIGTNC